MIERTYSKNNPGHGNFKMGKLAPYREDWIKR